MHDQELSRCRVCGLVQGAPPWGESGLDPTWIICDCCGTEFGYEDNNPQAAEAAREKWIRAGCPWADPKARPAGWNSEAQLANVPRNFPRREPAPAAVISRPAGGDGRKRWLLRYAALSVPLALLILTRSPAPSGALIAKIILGLAIAAVWRAFRIVTGL